MVIVQGMTSQVQGNVNFLGKVSQSEEVGGVVGIGVFDIRKCYDWSLVEVFACDCVNKQAWVYAPCLLSLL